MRREVSILPFLSTFFINDCGVLIKHTNCNKPKSIRNKTEKKYHTIRTIKRYIQHKIKKCENSYTVISAPVIKMQISF